MNQNDDVAHDTEDKAWWCLHGVEKELSFVELCNAHLKIDAQINPEKETNRYAPDLVVKGVVSDLKTQNTPFFSAKRYGMNPERTVTFNRKDYVRYKQYYPSIDIYFWVEWTQTTWKDLSVQYLAGIYRLPFKEIAQLIEAGAKEHSYQKRVNDQINAKSSFLLNLDDLECVFETKVKPG